MGNSELIPLMDLVLQNGLIAEELKEAFSQCLKEASFIGGSKVADFEMQFSAALRCEQTIGVGNGTDALFLALKALGIGSGDAVIVPANSFFATAEAVVACGARAVFVDVDPNTFHMNLDQLEGLLEAGAKKKGGNIVGLIPVHLYGRAVDMSRILELSRRFDQKVIEDCAQSHLAQWKGKFTGTFGDAGCFSFYPGKNLGALGDGGAVTSNRSELARKVRMFANHGRQSKYEHEFSGYNSRLDALQASFLSLKLGHLAVWTERRQMWARRYVEELSEVGDLILPEIPQDVSEHVFHLFVVRTPRRDELQSHLSKNAVSAGIHYPKALPFLEAFKSEGFHSREFPIAFQLQNEVLSLPLYPEMTEEQHQHICRSVKNFFGEV